MVINRKKFHEKIRQSGKTNNQIAKESGVSIQTIKHIQPRPRYANMQYDKVVCICETIGIDVQEVFMSDEKIRARLEELEELIQSESIEEVYKNEYREEKAMLNASLTGYRVAWK